MSGLVSKVMAPFFAVAVIVGAVLGLVKLGWVSEEVAFWLSPTLFAVLFLALGIWFFLTGARVWLWPIGAGFVVQTVGLIIFLTSRKFESSWTVLWFSLGAVGLVLLIMGIVFAVSTIRARLLERQIAEGSGGSEQDLARIREDMKEALDLLRRAGKGRNAIYELPWFLVMGRPAAGKTVAIKNSELGLPVKRDWVKGVGGTYTCDWFFTNELIFLDTPGKWVTEGADEEGREHWRELVRLLRKNRGRQPLDGLIVVVPADDLLSLNDDELEDQATNIREVVDLIHDELSFRFPIYLLVSKCDLVEGFVDFFKGLPSQRRHEILGWSNDDPNRSDAARLVQDGFKRVQRRLQTYRLEMLGKIAKRTQARRLFFFTEEFKGLEQPLATFADAFFLSDRFSEAPVFRGFYFTSGTQEGAPLSKAMADLSRALGVPAGKTQEVEQEESKRSYFLLDLFRELMVGDEGLVGRTAGHWWRLRRNTFLGAFAPAGIALVFMFLALIALGLNKLTYSNLEDNSQQIADQLAAKIEKSEGVLKRDDFAEALELTGRIRSYHVQMSGFQPFRTFGMRQPGELRPKTLDMYRNQFGRAILWPTLAEAERRSMDPGKACIERIGLLRSVVWLRTAQRVGYEHLSGLDEIWGFDPDDDAGEAEDVRDEFRRQYAYLWEKLSEDDDDSDDLLRGFSVRRVAKSIAEDCGRQGATSTLAQYASWQEECRDPVAPVEIQCCFQILAKVIRTRQDDYDKLRDNFKQLKNDLEDLKADVPEADRAARTLDGVDLTQEKMGTCLKDFESILPRITAYAIRDDLVEQCQDKVETSSSKAAKRLEVLGEQRELQKDERDELDKLLARFYVNCGEFGELELEVLANATESYRRVACGGATLSEGDCDSGKDVAKDRPRKRPPPPARAPKPVAGGQKKPVTVSKLAPVARSRYDWFENPRSVDKRKTPDAWRAMVSEVWTPEWESIHGPGYTPAQTQREVGRVRNAVAGWVSGYESWWIQYLESIRLQEKKGTVSAWLTELSVTKEYADLISKASEAASISKAMTESPFDAGAGRLSALESLADLDLKTYLSNLGKIAKDITSCEENVTRWQSYRTDLKNGGDDNSLVAARAWVRLNAGPSLAGGSLTSVLSQPLDVAEGYILGGDPLRTMWDDLRRLYEDEIQGRAPVAGGPEAELVSVKSLQALLGGATGAVARMKEVSRDSALTPQAEEWLAEATRFSELFFEPETDTLRPIVVSLKIEDEEYEPEEGFGEAFRLEAVSVHLAEGTTFKWVKEDSDREDQQKLEFFVIGDDASDYAYVKAVVAERKIWIKRMGKKKHKPGEGMVVVEIEEDFAPLRLMAAGRTGEDKEKLRYELEIPWKKNKTGVVRLTFRLTRGDELLDLMEKGLSAPPETLAEN